MAVQSRHNRAGYSGPIILATLGTAILLSAPPVYEGGYDLGQVTASVCYMASLPRLGVFALRKLASKIELAEAGIVTGLKGTARWATSLKDFGGEYLKASLFKTGHGSYWGTLKRGFLGFGCRAIFLKSVAVSLIVGTTGSGKNVRHSDIQLLAIPGSKIHIDFKEEDTVKYYKVLIALGYDVKILNFGGQFEDRIEISDSYNYLAVITANFMRPGGILDVDLDARQHANIIVPEPDKGGENTFFRNGSRDLIVFAIHLTCITEGPNANYADVVALLQDRDRLLSYAEWACGRLKQEDGSLARLPIYDGAWAANHTPDQMARYERLLSRLGASVVELMTKPDAKYFESFLQGVLGEMSSMHEATTAYDKECKSTFTFGELKAPDKDTIAIIIPDNTRPEANEKRMELLFENAKIELVRHPNKSKRVTCILQEVNNFKFPKLMNFVSWCRAYGISLMLYTQSLRAFAAQYSDDGLSSILSESQIKLFLPSLRENSTQDMIEKMLGQMSYMLLNHSGKRKGDNGLDGYSYSEEAKALLPADKIRQLRNRGILFSGNSPPALVRLPSIAAIWPLRSWQEISPFFNKLYRERISLFLIRYAPWMPSAFFATRKRRKQLADYQKRKAS
ncbi:type IV secretory system conjugative DNA transfer family protein [Litorimonas sp.]|uniref:type IV secretory system conjugative DNA transfer family protein n=1 Tax=Litorimonas sp. TaxID=1892381 RepID=UPI003A8C0AD4